MSFPQLQALQTKERKEAASNGQDMLDNIANQGLQVELPDAASQGNPRAGNWNSENKLINRTHPTPTPSSQFQNAPAPYANPNGPSDN
jgi:hypothetical protein